MGSSDLPVVSKLWVLQLHLMAPWSQESDSQESQQHLYLGCHGGEEGSSLSDN